MLHAHPITPVNAVKWFPGSGQVQIVSVVTAEARQCAKSGNVALLGWVQSGSC